MATELLDGQVTWSVQRDEEGHREYKVVFRVVGDVTDGPANVLTTPGLPLPGSFWLIDADVDLWAWCRWRSSATPEVEGEPNEYWKVEMLFSTKPPPPNTQRCNTVPVEDPLLEPMKLGGGFYKYTEPAAFDRNGRPIVSSSWEFFTGPQIEFDAHRPTVWVEQNVPNLELPLCSGMMNHVNSVPMWGLGTRQVKLSNFTWERKYWGLCSVYYTRKFEFDVNPRTFDRLLRDEGTKALSGHWEGRKWVIDLIGGFFPDPAEPLDFDRVLDRNGNPMRVILDGHGKPWDATGVTTGTDDDQPGQILVEKYDEANFFLLGVPVLF